MKKSCIWMGVSLLILVGVLLAALPAVAAEYTKPQALAIGDTYRLEVDAWTGDEGTTEPTTDANDGLSGDNPYFQRNNIAHAHNSGGCQYWYTSSHYNLPHDPNPAGPQWVDYKPPLNILGAGRYRIVAQYRNTPARATYPAQYIVHLGDGSTTTVNKSQLEGVDCVEFQVGEFDLGSTGWMRVNDTGSQSLVMSHVKFTWLGPSVPDTDPPSVPTNMAATPQSSSIIKVTWTASTDNLGVMGYKIYRDGSQAGTSSTTSYNDTGLQGNTTYTYRVSAYDGSGNESAQSSPVTAATPPAGMKIYATEDTYTRSGTNANTNYNEQGLQAKSQSGDYHRHSWLEFIFSSSSVASAYIYMYQYSDWLNNYSTRLRASDAYDLDESTLTYATEPAGADTWTSLGGWSATTGAKQYYYRDITTYYNGHLGKKVTMRFEVTNGDGNYGGYYEDSEGSRYANGDYTGSAANYPYIEVTSDTTPPNPGTCTSPASAKASFNVDYSGAGDTGGSGLQSTALWFKKESWGTWQSSGMSSAAASGSFTFDGAHGLSGEGTYYFTMYASDNAGNNSTHPSEKGDGDCSTIYDLTPPSGEISINSGASYTASTAASLVLTADGGASGMGQMRLSNDGSSWNEWEAYIGSKPWDLPSGDGEKTVYVQYKDNAGNESSSFTDTIILDETAPTTPAVADDGAYTTSTSQIHASWAATDGVSGISEYQYAISATKTEGEIVFGGGWESAGMQTEATRTGLTLTYGQAYYALVKVKNGAGLWSAIGASDGITVVENTVTSISGAKALPNGSSVGLASKVVTAIFSDYLYVQEPDRKSGIRVDPVEMPAGLAVGDIVDVGGTVQTVNGERRIVDAVIAVH